MAGLFITATGTAIGKTLVTSILASQVREKGLPVRALKPVISGFDDDAPDAESDTDCLLKAQGLPVDDQHRAMISPWRFKLPLSPDMAAAKEGRRIPFDALVEFCQDALASPDFTLIEGVGGPFVPLDQDYLVADWMKALSCPAILVAGSYLGTISHTIANFEALDARAIPPRAVIISQSEDEPVSLFETRDALAARLPCPVHVVPRLSGPRPWRHAPDLLSLPGII